MHAHYIPNNQITFHLLHWLVELDRYVQLQNNFQILRQTTKLAKNIETWKEVKRK